MSSETKIVVKVLMAVCWFRDRSALNLSFLIFTTASKKLTFSFDSSPLNLILGLKPWSSHENFSMFSSRPVQIKNKSWMNHFHTQGSIGFFLGNCVSMFSIKIQAYRRTITVPLAVPDIFWRDLELNSKDCFLRQSLLNLWYLCVYLLLLNLVILLAKNL